MTITIDDAGSGDILYGVVVGAYRKEKDEFRYDIIDVKYFQPSRFKRKEYLKEATKIVFSLLSKMKLEEDECVFICRGYLFEEAVELLQKKLGEKRVKSIKVGGTPQEYVEIAYLDELRNLGYEPIDKRETKRAKSFYHMLNWLEEDPKRIRYAKTGWPKLGRYRLFKESKNL